MVVPLLCGGRLCVLVCTGLFFSLIVISRRWLCILHTKLINHCVSYILVQLVFVFPLSDGSQLTELIFKTTLCINPFFFKSFFILIFIVFAGILNGVYGTMLPMGFQTSAVKVVTWHLSPPFLSALRSSTSLATVSWMTMKSKGRAESRKAWDCCARSFSLATQVTPCPLRKPPSP